MANKALLVGINEYLKVSALRGCVNDILDVAHLLVNKCGFNESDVRLLADGRATKAAITQELESFVAALRPGDRAVFHFSGHGLQLPELRDGDEPDGLDEAICPVDFDPRSALRDHELLSIFAAVPQGVSFVWISDSCHSGHLSRRALDPGAGLPNDARPRTPEPPGDIAWTIDTIRNNKSARGPAGLRSVAGMLRAALITGCEADKTSADARFLARWNGALTHFLVKTLSASGGLDQKLREVVDDVRTELKGAGFAQIPQLEGEAALHELPFLAIPGDSVAPPAPLWSDILSRIDAHVAASPSEERRLIAANAAAARALSRNLGLELTAEHTGDALLVRPRGGTVVRAFWWGFHIQFSSQDLKTFVTVGGSVSAIAAAIGPVTGPAAPFVGLAAAFVAAGMGIMRSLDRGRGVYLSMSWFAPGIFIPTSV
jgi:metacaspase-1